MLARCCPFVLFLQASLLYVSGFLGARLCSKCNSKYVWLSVFLFVCLLVCLLLFAHLRGQCSLQQGFCLCVICGSCVGKSVQHVFAFVPVCLCVCVCVCVSGCLFMLILKDICMFLSGCCLFGVCVCVCMCYSTTLLPFCAVSAGQSAICCVNSGCMSLFQIQFKYVWLCVSPCVCLPVCLLLLAHLRGQCSFQQESCLLVICVSSFKKNDCVCLCVSVLLLLYIIFTSCCPAVLCVYVC